MPETDALSVLDAGFLEVEEGDTHSSLTIGALAVLAGPSPDPSEFNTAVAARVLALPHARDRLRTRAIDLGTPWWERDPAFDLEHHLRRVALPDPGDDRTLFGFVARVNGHRLDRDHPLWECWLVEGLSANRWAILARMHHCMADGISGVRLFESVCDDLAGETRPRESPPDGTAHAAPASRPLHTRVPGMFRTALGLPERLLGAGYRAIHGVADLAGGLLRPAESSSLIGPIGRQRRYCGVSVPMSDVREVCDVFGVTVNDVALAAITGGLRTILLGRGERPGARTVRTLVPVSVRVSPGDGPVHNELSLMLPFLPVDVEDHVDQLLAVHDRLSAHKAGHETRGGEAFTSMARYGPFLPLAWGIRLATRFPQHSVVAVTTNLPGPQRLRRILGRPVLTVYPYVPIALRLRVGIAVLSYDGALTFGLTGDYDTNPDLDDLAASIESGIRSLRTAARLGDAS